MGDKQFDLIFRGDIVAGHNIVQVKQRLAALFKRTEAQIEPLFSGAAMPLKKGLDAGAAEKYRKALEQAGAMVELREAGGAAAKPVAKPAPKVEPRQSPPQPSLAIESEATAAAEPVPQKAAPAATATAEFSLAPIDGGNLLSEDELAQARPQPVQVSTLNADLRPLDGPLVDPTEIERQQAVAVADIDFDLAEPGADIIANEFRAPPPVVEVEDLGAELAPVGSDLGQVKKTPPPPAPDTSGISLAD